MLDSSSSTFQVSDHSGDLKIEAWGRDCLEALAHASLALINQIVSLEQIGETEERSMIVSGDDDQSRCIAFLNELLYLVYAKHWLPGRVKLLRQCQQKGCQELEAILVGEPLDTSRHELKYDIKAVTYHDFEIQQEAQQITLRFVCDL